MNIKNIKIGSVLDETGRDAAWSGDYYTENLTSPKSSCYNENKDIFSIDIDLKDGQYVMIDSGNVIFTPYQGKPTLGFK